MPIVGAVGSDGALGFEKGVTGLTVILGAVTFTGDLTISLGLTDAPSSIWTIGSCWLRVFSNP